MRITLEQWKVFVAVVEHEGSAKAADKMCKSQSAVSHSIKKMEAMLGQALFKVKGRKLELTSLGRLMLPKAKLLLGEAAQIETLGTQYKEGMLNELAIAVDVLVPVAIMEQASDFMTDKHPGLSIRVYETTLSGTKELLEEGRVHLGIAGTVPPNHVVEPFMTISMICVAAVDHPVNQKGEISNNLLREHRQIVIRDSGKQALDTGWLGGKERWTVSHISTSLYLILRGRGYAWLPDHYVRGYVERNELACLSLKSGKNRTVQLHMAFPEKYIFYKEVQSLAESFYKAAAYFQASAE